MSAGAYSPGCTAAGCAAKAGAVAASMPAKAHTIGRRGTGRIMRGLVLDEGGEVQTARAAPRIPRLPRGHLANHRDDQFGIVELNPVAGRLRHDVTPARRERGELAMARDYCVRLIAARHDDERDLRQLCDA